MNIYLIMTLRPGMKALVEVNDFLSQHIHFSFTLTQEIMKLLFLWNDITITGICVKFCIDAFNEWRVTRVFFKVSFFIFTMADFVEQSICITLYYTVSVKGMRWTLQKLFGDETTSFANAKSRVKEAKNVFKTNNVGNDNHESI